MRRGLIITGGGAQIRGLDELLSKELEIPVHVAEDPLSSVINGVAILLDDFDSYRDVMIDNEEQLPPR